MGSPRGSSVKKLDSKEIDSKIIALDHLMHQAGWREFVDMVRYLQGVESMKLFEKRFLNLPPEDKDREHRAIVAVNQVLERILDLPGWLEKKKPERWNQVLQHLNKKEA